MSFSFTLSAFHLRNFITSLSCYSKLCEQVSLEPSANHLSIRGVGATKATHMLLGFGVHCFDTYDGSRLNELSTLENGVSQLPCFFLETKSLMCTILRSCPTMLNLTMTYDTAKSADHVMFVVGTTVGVRRCFKVNLNIGQSAKATLQPELYSFEAVADPKAWASFFSSFPSNTDKLGVHPSETRLTLSASDEIGGGSSSSAVASIEPRQFLSYRYTQQLPQNSLPGSQHPGAAPGQQNNGGLAAPVGKAIDFKPLKIFSYFTEQLGMRMRLLSGGSGLPVILEAISRETESPVAHLSLLIAAMDVEINVPPPRNSALLQQAHQPPQYAQGGGGGGAPQPQQALRSAMKSSSTVNQQGNTSFETHDDSFVNGVGSGSGDRSSIAPSVAPPASAYGGSNLNGASVISGSTVVPPSDLGGPSIIAATTQQSMFNRQQSAIETATTYSVAAPSSFSAPSVAGGQQQGVAAEVVPSSTSMPPPSPSGLHVPSSANQPAMIIAQTPASAAKRSRDAAGIDGNVFVEDSFRVEETPAGKGASMQDLVIPASLPYQTPRLEGQQVATTSSRSPAAGEEPSPLGSHPPPMGPPGALQDTLPPQVAMSNSMVPSSGVHPSLSHVSGTTGTLQGSALPVGQAGSTPAPGLHIAQTPIGQAVPGLTTPQDQASGSVGGSHRTAVERYSGHGMFTLDFDALDDSAVDAFVYGTNNVDGDAAMFVGGSGFSGGLMSGSHVSGSSGGASGGGFVIPATAGTASSGGFASVRQAAAAMVPVDEEGMVEGFVVQGTPGV